MIVQKKNGKRIRAYQLGTDSAMEKQMISEGKIIVCVDGSYELFSREARQQGEKACTGDYFKIDSAGYPYPNKRDWFCRIRGYWMGTGVTAGSMPKSPANLRAAS